MISKAQDSQVTREVAMHRIAESGRNWAAIRDNLAFQTPAPLFDRAMEISIAMLRGLRMVDETIVVLGDLDEERQP